ncbi:DUF2298 domain-containing protein [Haloarchaeobius sp. TZWWS8]|uniref:DUF2298 domain-containing protein n=1 Tax=Haloarchaeobius sp. TZWWS8 TaxID=3446121 RepID=UPI003EB7C873
MEYGLVLVWLVAVAGLAVVAAPLTSLLFSPLSDRGGTLAFPVALATLGVVSYWVGQLAFGWAGIVATLVVLGGGSAYARYVGTDTDWQAVGAGLAVFTVGFGLVTIVRAADPGIISTGGEKYLDFGLLKTLMRAPALPPEDFWYAGDRVQYYYGGHLVASQLTRLVGTQARYGYNLALATFYGALVAGVFGVARNVAAERGLPQLAAGALSVFFVGIASNLTPLARTVVWLLPASMKTTVDSNPQYPGPEVVKAFGVEWHALAGGPEYFNYWPASRVIPNTINEFPLFSWLNGDLHAHMTSTHLLVLAAAVGLAYWLTPAGAVTRRRAYLFVCAPVLAGWLAVVNTWSYPSVAGVTTLAAIFASAHPASVFPGRISSRVDAIATDSRAAAEATRVLTAGVVGLGVGIGGFVVALPFFTGATSGQHLAFLPERTGFAGLVLVHGAFLLVTLVYFLPRLAPGRNPLGFPVGIPSVTKPALEDETVVVGLWGVTFVAFAGVAWLLDAAVLVVVTPALVVGWLLLRLDREVGYETVLVVAAIGLVTMVEFVYVSERAGSGRFNTVFKFYMQVWVLWGTAVGVMLTDVVARQWPRWSIGDRITAGRDRDTARLMQVAAVLFAAFLIASTSIYAGLALTNHFDRHDGDYTLDGKQWTEDRYPDQYAAIEWLDAKDGRPVVVEAPTTVHMYASNRPDTWLISGASSLTGLPTIAGWGHASNYHTEAGWAERMADVKAVYQGNTAERAAVLAKYDVRYIYVGPHERQHYAIEDLAADPGIAVAKRFGDVVIYEVDQDELRG